MRKISQKNMTKVIKRDKNARTTRSIVILRVLLKIKCNIEPYCLLIRYCSLYGLYMRRKAINDMTTYLYEIDHVVFKGFTQ